MRDARRGRGAAAAVAAAVLGGLILAVPGAAAQMYGTPPSGQGYYIVLTPSGVPYTVPVGAPVSGPAIWPYQEQPIGAAPPMLGSPGQPLAPAGTPQSQPGIQLQPPPGVDAAPLDLPPSPGTPPPDLAAPSPPPPLPERDLAPPPAPIGPLEDTAEAAPEIASAARPRRYKDGIYAIDKDYWLSYPENAWRIVTAPFNFDTEDWLITGGIVGAAGLALAFDDDIVELWDNEDRDGLDDDVFGGFEELGSFRNVAAASLAGYAVAELAGAPREKAAALMTLESLILAGGLTQGLKLAVARERPTDTDDQYGFFDRDDNRANSSFPSGHATHAFSTATVLSEVYGPENPWVPFVAYPLAGTVALARLHKDRHWLSDLIIGGGIGYGVGKLVTNYNPFLEEQGITMAPTLIGETPAVSFTYAF